MLVAMATGTGKTFMTVNEVYRLMKSGVAKRILFLVDRRALAAQAVRTFASFEPEPGHKFNQLYQVYSQRFHKEDFDEDEKFDPTVLPGAYLLEPKLGDAFVYVCTIQRMAINLFGRETVLGDSDEVPDEDAEELKNIPIHAFDLVIADECHRGYTATQVAIWRKTLEHFDATKIGLTATPASHTTTYFKDIVYRYKYERAVREGYLVDYDVVSVHSNVRMILAVGTQVDKSPASPTDRRSKQDISSLARYKADDVRGFAFEIQGRNMLSLSLGHYTSAGQKHTVRAGHVAGRHPMRTDLELRCLPRCSALGVELDRFSYVRAVDG